MTGWWISVNVSADEEMLIRSMGKINDTNQWFIVNSIALSTSSHVTLTIIWICSTRRPLTRIKCLSAVRLREGSSKSRRFHLAPLRLACMKRASELNIGRKHFIYRLSSADVTCKKKCLRILKHSSRRSGDEKASGKLWKLAEERKIIQNKVFQSVSQLCLSLLGSLQQLPLTPKQTFFLFYGRPGCEWENFCMKNEWINFHARTARDAINVRSE